VEADLGDRLRGMLGDEHWRLLGLTPALQIPKIPPRPALASVSREETSAFPMTRSWLRPGGYRADERDRTGMKEERHATEGVECQA